MYRPSGTKLEENDFFAAITQPRAPSVSSQNLNLILYKKGAKKGKNHGKKYHDTVPVSDATVLCDPALTDLFFK